MLKTTLGQILVNEALPEDMRDYNRVLTKKDMGKLATELAEKHPEKYREAMKRLHDVGRAAAYSTNGLSFGLKDIKPTLAVRDAQVRVQRQLRAILSNPQLDDKTRSMEILKLASSTQRELVEKVYEEARGMDNPLAHQVLGSGHGNKFSLNSIIGADMQYVDHKNEPIPIPVLRGYSQGLRPVEYFAGAFGTRKGVMDLKTATADAGFFGKQLVQMTHRLLVTGQDEDDPERQATAHDRGYPTDVDDTDNEGSFLARPVGPYKRDTLLTPKILRDIKEMGVQDILVRSPIVGGPEDGGVYAKDVGYREKRRLPPIGDYVGIAAAQALSEPVTQAQISSKHSGGVGGAGSISGFKAINSLVQVPKTYPGAASHAQLDGRVQEIREAPQGGYYVQIGGQDHYVPVDRKLQINRGDEIEAGDVLSDGIPNPAEVVKHKGIGEGRRYFVQAMRQVMQNSGIAPQRRNLELLSRGLVNHVRMTDEHASYSPEDVVPYSVLERNWQPRAGSVTGAPKSLTGHYLERPVLHYSIGTKVGKNVASTLDRYGIKQVEAHRQPPPFQPEMIRGMSNISNDQDWMTRMLGSYQQKGLLSSVHRGVTSDTAGSSFVPSLARGETFGVSGTTSGWRP
jgi:DNA-directed RNA polymerase subunit beta'